jgi:ubiquinol-cytochrome c reductase iron-sulfur subunit
MSLRAREPGDERSIERVAAASFVVAAGSAILLIVVYVRGGRPQLEGVLLALAFGGLGLGLVVWANGLLGGEPHQEEREELRASEEAAEAVEEDIERGGELRRRVLLKRTLAVAAGAIGAAVLVPIRSLGPAPKHRLLHTAWGRGVAAATADGRLVHADEVPTDALLTVFPEDAIGSADGQAVLVRVEPSLLQLGPGRRGWAPEGLVAYSKVCTHAGCPVGLYQAATHQLLCPCHQSAFDVLRGAQPVSGPAAWPLPQLPLEIDDQGIVRATGDFSAPVGPGWWAG